MLGALTSVAAMTSDLQLRPITWPWLAWTFAALAGFLAPASFMAVTAGSPDAAEIGAAAAPLLAIGLMGAGMIGASAAGRLWIGIVLAVLVGSGLAILALTLGMPSLPHPAFTALAFLVAAVSFAARGALFALSGGAKGWWIALAVVAGEAAIILTAWTQPGALPDWLLVLLPAQWATIAIEASLTGAGEHIAIAALVALGGTAAATMLVAKLWPSRWPYAVMFTTWIALSVLVWNSGYAEQAHGGSAQAGVQVVGFKG